MYTMFHHSPEAFVTIVMTKHFVSTTKKMQSFGFKSFPYVPIQISCQTASEYTLNSLNAPQKAKRMTTVKFLN